jgi:hypothetical protein
MTAAPAASAAQQNHRPCDVVMELVAHAANQERGNHLYTHRRWHRRRDVDAGSWCITVGVSQPAQRRALTRAMRGC